MKNIQLKEYYPGVEYKHLNKLVGNFLRSLRMSMGSKDFSAIVYMSPAFNVIFWFFWIIVCFVTTIILLNFLYAELYGSYFRVAQTVQKMTVLQKI